MELTTIVATALSILKTIGLSEWIGQRFGGDIGEKVADKVIAIAQTATQSTTPQQALEQISSHEDLSANLKELLIKHEFELGMAHYEDIKSARDLYKATGHTVSDDIAKKVMTYNMLFVFLLVAINIFVIVSVTDPAIVGGVGTLIGASISYLWQERGTVISFFFGSSSGSKDKQVQLDKLNKK